MGSSAGDGRMGYQIGLVVLFLGDRFAQAGHRLRLGRCCLKRSLQFAGWLLAHRVDKCAFSLRTFYCVVVGLRRGAHRRLFLATARCARAAAWHHLELAVHELGRADLDWLIRVQLVRCGVLREPQSCRKLCGTRSLLQKLLLFGKHNNLLLALLRGRVAATTRSCGVPRLRVEGSLRLQHL